MFPSTAGSLASGFIIKDGVVMTTQEAAALAASPAVAAVARTATNGGAGAPSRAPSSAAASGAARVFVKSTLPLEERMARCLSVGEECIQVRGALFGLVARVGCIVHSRCCGAYAAGGAARFIEST